MRTDLLRTSALALVLAAGTSLAMAQSAKDQTQGQASPAGGPPQHQVIGPPEAGATANTPDHVRQSVPGASLQTMPSTISAENAAKDKSWWLDRGTALTAEQKHAIYEKLGKESQERIPPSPDLHAEASAELPQWVNYLELPSDLKAQIPFIKDFKYAVVQDKVLLIDPDDGVIATVIEK